MKKEHIHITLIITITFIAFCSILSLDNILKAKIKLEEVKIMAESGLEQKLENNIIIWVRNSYLKFPRF